MNHRNIAVRRRSDGTTAIEVDGKEFNLYSMERAVFTMDRESVPSAEITLSGVPDIIDDMDLTVTLDPKTTRDCVKYLALQLQLDDAFREAWIASIASALADTEFESDNYKKAQRILNRIMD